MTSSPLLSPSIFHNAATSDEPVVILDATFALPNQESKTPYEHFCDEHISGAQFFDIDDIADHQTDLPHMLPTPEVFAQKVGALGISNETHVLIYGQTGIAMGPARAWWMFQAFGHSKISLLNCSLSNWKAQGYAVVTTPPQPPTPASYTACFRPDMVTCQTEVESASQTKSTLILDARPKGRFSGEAPEPRAGLKRGCIPNSQNIPAGDLIDPETGGMLPKEKLYNIIPHEVIQHESPCIYTCGSGVTACVIALALHELGKSDGKVYDGSWAEWGRP